MANFRVIVLVGTLDCFLLTPKATDGFLLPQSDGKCEDYCNAHPDAVCRVVCQSHDADGKGTNCINQFFDNNGFMVDPIWYCWE